MLIKKKKSLKFEKAFVFHKDISLFQESCWPLVPLILQLSVTGDSSALSKIRIYRIEQLDK